MDVGRESEEKGMGYHCPNAVFGGARETIKCKASGKGCAWQRMCQMEGRIVLTNEAMSCVGRRWKPLPEKELVPKKEPVPENEKISGALRDLQKWDGETAPEMSSTKSNTKPEGTGTGSQSEAVGKESLTDSGAAEAAGEVRKKENRNRAKGTGFLGRKKRQAGS